MSRYACMLAREYVGTRARRDALSSAFSALGLRAVTADAEGSLDGMTAIDHLAVHDAWRADVNVVHPSPDERPLNEPPLHLADLEIPVEESCQTG